MTQHLLCSLSKNEYRILFNSSFFFLLFSKASLHRQKLKNAAKRKPIKIKKKKKQTSAEQKEESYALIDNNVAPN